MPLIAYPYITRVLGPASLGIVNYVDFTAQLFIMFAAFGVPFYGVRELARVRDDKVKRAKLIQELALLHVFFTMLAIFVFALLTFHLWKNNWLLYLFAMLNILFNALTFDWYIQGMEDFRFAAIRSLLVRTCMLIGFFVFVKSSADYSVYAGIFTAGFFIIALFNSFKLLAENKLIKQPLHFKQHLKPLWHFFLTASAISIYIYSDTLLLQYFTHNAAAVGYYTTTVKLVKIFLVVLLSIGTVMLPRLSFLAGEGNNDEIKKYLDKLLHFVILLGVPIGMGLLLLSHEIIFVVAGQAFLPAVPLMKILAFLPLLIGLSNIFCFQTLVPFKRENRFLVVVICGCTTSLLLNFILTPSLHETGSAIANFCTELLVTILAGWYAHKTIPFSPNTKTILQTIFCSLFFFPIIYGCRAVLQNEWSVFIVAILLCTAVYVILQLFIFKNKLVMELSNFGWQFFNRKNNC